LRAGAWRYQVRWEGHHALTWEPRASFHPDLVASFDATDAASHGAALAEHGLMWAAVGALADFQFTPHAAYAVRVADVHADGLVVQYTGGEDEGRETELTLVQAGQRLRPT
jgi:hypothetical protein